MKNLVRIAVVTTALGTGANAAPFLAIGDGAELFVTGGLTVRADDNIYLTSNTTSDTIFDLNPGLELTFGKGLPLNGSLTLVDSFSNYSDNSNLNTNLFSGNFAAGFDGAKLKLKFNLGYTESNQNAPDIRGLTRRDTFTTGGKFEAEFSEITSFGGGVTFSHANYKRKGYGDSDDLTVPLNIFYKWTPKVDLSVGYSYHENQTTVGSDATDHFFNIGARGEFTPLLTGSFSFGYRERRLASGGTESLPGLDASLTYALTPKTSIVIGATNDFSTAPQGAQQKNFSLNGSVSTKFNAEWSANAGLSYRAIDYYTRTDDYVEATLGVSYILNNYVSFNAGYTYRNNSSDLKGSEFSNNVFSISSNFRY